jgi:glycopeptide antibiotics resistance protein
MDYVISLLDIPVEYYLASLCIFFIVGRVFKNQRFGALTAYFFFFAAVTILNRRMQPQNPKLQLFWSWSVPALREQIIMNIVAFIPIGILAGLLYKGKGILIAVAFSVLIETMQLAAGRGLFELDDIVHNSAGALIGLLLVLAWRNMMKRFAKR